MNTIAIIESCIVEELKKRAKEYNISINNLMTRYKDFTSASIFPSISFNGFLDVENLYVAIFIRSFDQAYVSTGAGKLKTADYDIYFDVANPNFVEKMVDEIFDYLKLIVDAMG